MRPIAVLAISGGTLWANRVSDVSKQALPCPICDISFARVLSGDAAKVSMKALYFASRHSLDATWGIPFGLIGERSPVGKTSVSMVGGSSVSTDEGWPACLTMLPLGARRFAMW